MEPIREAGLPLATPLVVPASPEAVPGGSATSAGAWRCARRVDSSARLTRAGARTTGPGRASIAGRDVSAAVLSSSRRWLYQLRRHSRSRQVSSRRFHSASLARWKARGSAAACLARICRRPRSRSICANSSSAQISFSVVERAWAQLNEGNVVRREAGAGVAGSAATCSRSLCSARAACACSA